MSPRVTPKPLTPEQLAEGERRRRERREQYERTHRTPFGTGLKYGPGAANSYFRDLLLVAERNERKRAAYDSPVLRGRDQGDPERVPGILEPLDIDTVETRLHVTAREALERQQFAREQYDLSAAVATALIPTAQLPPALAAEFETAARSQAVVGDLLNAGPIPERTGMTVNIAKVTTGSTTTVMATEGDANSETDLVLALGSGSIAYVTGQLDVPRQLLDRAGNGNAGMIDAVIAADLGRAAGLAVDQQILYGTGSDGQTTGLLVAAGTNATTYTDASPTVAEFASKLGSNYSSTATADGQVPDTLLIHPRRLAWLQSQTIGSGEDQPRRVLSLYENVVQAPAIPTTLGTGTNEDRAITLRRDAVKVFADSRISVHPDPGSGTMTVRFVVTARVAVVVAAPAGVGVLSGTGLASPTYA